MNYEDLRKVLFQKNPLIHAITNPISITMCANAALAMGARPIMAEHPCEVEEITRSADALLLNFGNITDARIESIKISSKVATENKIPFIVDAVGASCSSFRRSLIKNLPENFSPSVIKGNYSEIYSLCAPEYFSSGVDADNTINPEKVTTEAIRLARKHNLTILASGKTDLITDGKRLAYIKNGVPDLSAITGTGCMLGMICACFLSVSESFDAAVFSAALLSICGEKSVTEKGYASFLVNLMNSLSTLSANDFYRHIKKEVIKIEKL